MLEYAGEVIDEEELAVRMEAARVQGVFVFVYVCVCVFVSVLSV